MDINVSQLFSIPVFAAQFQGFDMFGPVLLERARALCEAGDGVQASNRHAFHSKRDFHLFDDEATAWFRDSVLEFATAALSTAVRTKEPWHPEIVSCWSIAMDAGGWLVPHNHFPAPWAGVLYLDAEHARSTDPREGSGRLDLLCPISIAEVFGLQAEATVTPKDGCAVLFPGALQHAVHPHQSDRTRHSVSFNIAVRPDT